MFYFFKKNSKTVLFGNTIEWWCWWRSIPQKHHFARPVIRVRPHPQGPHGGGHGQRHQLPAREPQRPASVARFVATAARRSPNDELHRHVGFRSAAIAVAATAARYRNPRRRLQFERTGRRRRRLLDRRSARTTRQLCRTSPGNICVDTTWTLWSFKLPTRLFQINGMTRNNKKIYIKKRHVYEAYI